MSGRSRVRWLVGAGVLTAYLLVSCGEGGGCAFGPRAAFTDIEAGLPGFSGGSLAWGDYDNDGDLDLAIAGFVDNLGYFTKLYCNRGYGGFCVTAVELQGVYGCSLAWGDYDGDGDLDLALAGDAGGNYITKVYRNDGDAFTDIDAGLIGTYLCSLAWGDYDNDGDLDLAVAGGIGPQAKVYGNDLGVFGDVGANLEGVRECSLAWGDHDNDGDLDLALAGFRELTGDEVSKVYGNDGGTFADIAADIVGVGSFCSLAWGDYDSDGDLDLAIAGRGDPGDVGMIYRNEDGTFVDIRAGLRGVEMCSLAWGDYDNDGDFDLALAGYSEPGDMSKIYRNDGGTFADTLARLTGVRSCSLAWGDYDNDGDLDLVVAGWVLPASLTKIYRNEVRVPNTPPTAPTGLSAVPGSGEATFSWERATDAETPQLGLTYNLRVGTDTNKDDVMPAMADLTTGFRRIPAMGNVQHNTSWTLKLPAGIYYWSVQAIDTAFCGGPWADEKTVEVE